MVSQLKDIKNTVESNYPQPIVQAFRRYRVSPPADMGGRHKMLIDLFELLIKFLCIVELQEGLQRVRNFSDRLPQKEKSLEFLRRPSLGEWVGLLRSLSEIDSGTISLPWTKSISEWYLHKSDEQSSSVFALLDELEDVQFNRKNKRHRAEIINALVTYRNKNLGHGAHSESQELERRLHILEQMVAYLLESASFLGNMSLIFTEGIAVSEGNQWKIEAKDLRGLTEEPLALVLDLQLNLHELYLCDLTAKIKQVSPIAIGPFAVWQINEKTKQREVYLFNDAWRTTLEYLSYSSGTYYHPKELRGEFHKLLHLEMIEADDEAGYESLPLEQRAERAEQLFKFGLHLAAQGKLEDAVCQFEHSATFERRARTFLEMARLQKRLNDPADAIRHTLQNCLDIEPDNTEAFSILAALEDNDEVSPPARPDNAGAVAPDQLNCPMFVDAFTPRKFRNIGWLWWGAIMVTYYTTSAFLEFIFGEKLFVLSVGGMLVCTLVFTSGLTLARTLFLWLIHPLSLQLDELRYGRFEQWFAEQATLVFGDLKFSKDQFCFKATIRAEPGFWVGSIVWLIAIGLLIMVGTDSFRQCPLILCKRSIDFFFVIMWLYPCVRYIVRTTAFIFNYSKLSLKPMLTKINDEGMRSLGSLMAFNIGLACLAFVSYFLPASFTHHGRIYSDIVVLLVITLIVLIWSVGMPLMVKRAAKQAKLKSVMAYARHIETAFKGFLDNPTEETLKNYQWLTLNQKVIQRIGIWPLSLRQTLLLVVGSNVLLITLCVHYVLMRFHLWHVLLAP